MAQAVGTPAPVLGHDDTFGGHFFGAVDYTGPTSYVQGGDAIDPRPFGCPNTLLGIIGSVDQTGTYYVIARPMASGAQIAFQLMWFNVSNGQQVTASTNLSTFTVRLNGIGF